MGCPENIKGLLPDYHLDQLPNGEAEEVRRALRESPECRESLAEISEVLDHLALAAPLAEPPPALKARILAQAAQEPAPVREPGRETIPPGSASQEPAPRELRVVRPRRWQAVLLPYAGTAAAALLTVALGLAYLDLRAENRVLREEVGSLRAEVAERSQETPRGGELVVVPVEGTERAGGARGTAVADPQTGSLAFDAYDLPDAPEGHAYHAWLVGRDGAATDLGRMEPEGGEVRMTGRAPEDLSSYEALEVTVEPVGEEDGQKDGPVFLKAELT